MYAMRDSVSALSGITKYVTAVCQRQNGVEFSAVGPLKFQINIALLWNTGYFGVICSYRYVKTCTRNKLGWFTAAYLRNMILGHLRSPNLLRFKKIIPKSKNKGVLARLSGWENAIPGVGTGRVFNLW